MQGAIPIGAHLTTPRLGHMHHGIYVGGGAVIHYRGLYRWLLLRGFVERTTVARFARGHGYAIETHGTQAFSAEQICARARSRLGETRYHLLNNNCEHFASWCRYGESVSLQIEAWRARLYGVLRAAARPRSAEGHHFSQQHT